MKIIDVSNWIIASDDFIPGTREKKLIKEHEESEVEYYLKFNKGEGEIYAEVIASLLANNLFDVNVPESHFAEENGRIGVLSKSFNDKQKNTESLAAMDFFGSNFDSKDLTQYTIYKAYEVVEEKKLLNDFYQMCIFDYIIANQDRHSENWELLTNDEITPDYIFAPLFDHGTSLFGIYPNNDSRIKQMLSDDNMFNAYTNKAKTLFSIKIDGKIKKRPKAILILNYLYNQNEELFLDVFNQFNKINYDDVYECIEFIDDDILGNSRKELIGKLIMYRIEKIESLIKRGGVKNGKQ